MKFRTDKEELIVAILQRFLVATRNGFNVSQALELALESKAVERFGKDVVTEDAVRTVLKALAEGESFGPALAKLDVFSEYDLQIINAASESGRVEEACEDLVNLYLSGY